MVLKKKRFLFCGLAFVLGAMAMVGLTACGDKKSSETFAQDFYAMSAISSFNYLQQLDENKQSTQAEVQRPAGIQESDVNSISNYMGMFQNMLASDTNQYYTNGRVSVDDQYATTYNFKMTLSVPNLTGGQENFVMYYNEVYTDTEEEIDDHGMELEVNSLLSGIIVYNDSIYNVVGEREYEKEGRETEVAIEFKAFIDNNNYILVEHEMEDDEIGYQYTICNNGVTSTTEVEFENERGRKSLELEFQTESQGSRSEYKYEITESRTANLFNVVVRSAVDGSETGTRFTIEVTENGYIFDYLNGSTEIINL